LCTILIQIKLNEKGGATRFFYLVSRKIVRTFVLYSQTPKNNIMHRTEVLCPECFKGKLLKEDSTKTTGSGYCDRCGTKFVFTGERTVRFATANDKPDEPKARVEEAKPKLKYYATIMSEDPDPACDKKEAEAEARRRFSEEYDGLPIHWVQINEG
jgi:hypothetical protein